MTQEEIDQLEATLQTSAVPSKSERAAIEAKIADVVPARDVGVLEAAGRSASQGATLGFADELGGVLGAGYELAGRAFGQPAMQEFPQMSPMQAAVQRYVMEREAGQREMEEIRRARPVVSTVSEVAGSLLAPIPVVGKAAELGARGAAALGRSVTAGRAVGAGIYAGGLSGLGEGETVGDVAKSAALGGTMGVGMQRVAERLGPALKGGVAERAFKAIGAESGITNAIRNMGYKTQKEVDDLSNAAMKMKTPQGTPVITAGASKATIAARAKEIREDAGEAIGAITDQAEELGLEFDYDRAALAAANAIRYRDTQALEAAGDAVEFINNIRKAPKIRKLQGIPELSFSGARQLKTSAQQSVNWKDKAPISKELYRDAVQGFTSDFQEQVREKLGEAAYEKLKKANKQFGYAADIEELATESALRESQRRKVGLVGSIMGGSISSAIGTGWPAIAAAVVVPQLEFMARTRGPAFSAVAREKTAAFLQKHGAKLQDAAERGQTAAASAHYVLANRDPEYKRDLEQLETALRGE